MILSSSFAILTHYGSQFFKLYFCYIYGRHWSLSTGTCTEVTYWWGGHTILSSTSEWITRSTRSPVMAWSPVWSTLLYQESTKVLEEWRNKPPDHRLLTTKKISNHLSITPGVSCHDWGAWFNSQPTESSERGPEVQDDLRLLRSNC